MKIAAGCFGCLAFLFFGLALVLSFGTGVIATMLSGSGVEDTFAQFSATIAQGSGGCLARLDIRIDTEFAYFPGDEVGILATRVQDCNLRYRRRRFQKRRFF